ncbi:sulfotransferase domain-containing protein [Lusitaniella coriacea]|uniref:sulfotransferase domain-containing protein n=1 Tax=Lusitaniella coriacea TaxID=1983105 RepID=UPI003CFABFE3
MKINDFTLIVGAAKCGTTSLFFYLSQHPQICPCKIKEPKFFSRDERWNKGFQWYQGLWNWDEQVHKTALEATPGYTDHFPITIEVVQRIASIDANFKFIYIMRNPLERIESALQHGYYQARVGKSGNGEDAFEHFLKSAIDKSKYAQKISEYYRQFLKEDILLLQLDDLKETPSAVMQQVCIFLKINDSFEFTNLEKAHNKKNSYRTDTLWRKLTRMKRLQPMANLIPEQYKKQLRTYLSRPPRTAKDVPPTLTQKQKKEILRDLREDLHQLHWEYGVDVTRWGFEV